jgi:nucleotide-binding universal stress UspA family protein
MKKILCAVDFSTGSLHALDYAVKMACRLEAEVEMVWVDNTAEASSLTAISKDLRLEVKKQFEELMSERQQACSSIKIEYKLKKGKVYREVSALASAGKADLIVAGSHGVSGFEQHWIGSNAFRIVSRAPVPVITVPLNYDIQRPVNKIVLPMDSTADTRLKVPVVIRFAKAFGAEMIVLALSSTDLLSLQKKVESNAAWACNEIEKAGQKASCERRKGKNITQTTIEFATETDADLIAIMTEKDSSTSSLMLGQYARQMVNNASVPVLSVNADTY